MTKNINAEVVTVGTELLLGQIVNTNAQWISEVLSQDGINILHHSVVGDNLSRVEKAFRQAGERSDVIVVTGGLGPTDDDLTREAFQRISNEELVIDETAMHKIKDYYKKQGTNMTDNNRKQARVFKHARVIKNSTGMAPGMIVNRNNKMWIFLPGVPPEMKQMVTDGVIPYLRTVLGGEMVIRSEVLRFTGIGEAQLEDQLSAIIKSQTNPTIALLAQKDGLIIRLTAKAETETKAIKLLRDKQGEIENYVGEYLYGTGQLTLDNKIVDMLKNKNASISAAESLTGGMFTEKIIDNPGASQVCPGGIISYSSNMKHKLLNIPLNIIDTYGTISEKCAEEMAKRVSDSLETDYGISFTGVAGPDSSEGREAGTVFISVYDRINNQLQTNKYNFQGNRKTIRQKTVNKGLEVLYYFIKN